MRLTSLLAAFALFLLSFLPPVLAAETEKNDEKYAQWMTYYYMGKDHGQMRDFIGWLETSKILEKSEASARPMIAFLTVAFAGSPAQVEGWLKDQNLTGKTKEAVESAQQKSTSSFEIIVKDATALDELWSGFMASGDSIYIKKIIDILDETATLSGDAKTDAAIHNAALWSLAGNMQKHELVRRALVSEASTRPDAIKKQLEVMLAQEPQRFATRDGDFSAMIIITDENGLNEFDKHSGENAIPTDLAKAKRGDVVAVKIAFTGMTLTDALMANVDYDMKIMTPEGKVYDGGDIKNREALKDKMPVRFAVFDNRAFIKVKFEPTDPLGKYQITAEVRDNIGKKKVALSKEIELVE